MLSYKLLDPILNIDLVHQFYRNESKHDDKWNIEHIVNYNMDILIVVYEDDIPINVSFAKFYTREDKKFLRIGLRYLTASKYLKKYRNLLWIEGGIVDTLLKEYPNIHGMFTTYYEENIKLYRLCKHKLKNGSGKFADPDNYYFQKFEIVKPKKVYFRYVWQYIAYYNRKGIKEQNYEYLLDTLHDNTVLTEQNFIITIKSNFTDTHGGMNLSLVKQIAKAIDYKVIAISSFDDFDDEVDYKIITPFSIAAHNQQPNNSNHTFFFQKFINDNLKNIKIGKVLFFLEWHLWSNLKPFRDIANESIAFHRIICSKLISTNQMWNGSPLRAESVMLTAEKKMLDTADTIYVGSNGIKNSIIEDYDTTVSNITNKIKIVPIYSSKLPAFIKRQHTPNFDSYNVCYIGRLDFQKGYWRLYQQTEKYNIIIPNKKFAIWNNNISAEKNWHKRQWANYIEDCAFCLFPAIYETRGLVIQEVMALGMIPIVENNPYGLAEQVEDKVTGFLVDFCEPVDIIVDKIKETPRTNLIEMIERNKEYYKDKSFISSFTSIV